MGQIKKLLKFQEPTISGLKVIPLKEISDNRGSVLHMLRSDADHFRQFGEIYFSEINPGKVKTWKNHTKIIQNLTVPVGKVLFKFYDDRLSSKSFGKKEKIIIGRPNNYNLIIVPPLVWYSFENIPKKHSIVATCHSKPPDPKEVKKNKPKIPKF